MFCQCCYRKYFINNISRTIFACISLQPPECFPATFLMSPKKVIYVTPGQSSTTFIDESVVAQNWIIWLKFHLLLWRISFASLREPFGWRNPGNSFRTQGMVTSQIHFFSASSHLDITGKLLHNQSWPFWSEKTKGKERKGKEIIRLVLRNWEKSSIYCFVLYPPRVTLNNPWVKWDFLTLNMQKEKISCKDSMSWFWRTE